MDMAALAFGNKSETAAENLLRKRKKRERGRNLGE
jgi:hypothetical protein